MSAAINNDNAKKIITTTVNSNKVLSKKLPSGVKPNPVTYYLDYRGKQVFIGIDLITGYYQVGLSPFGWPIDSPFRKPAGFLVGQKPGL